ncbi:hypothetical protein C8R43DRAFT_947988 [Mycena crocata]|nr:hypothetical protein C8R43DRAFT_947988 [Mycena crocata]
MALSVVVLTANSVEKLFLSWAAARESYSHTTASTRKVARRGTEKFIWAMLWTPVRHGLGPTTLLSSRNHHYLDDALTILSFLSLRVSDAPAQSESYKHVAATTVACSNFSGFYRQTGGYRRCSLLPPRALCPAPLLPLRRKLSRSISTRLRLPLIHPPDPVPRIHPRLSLKRAAPHLPDTAKRASPLALDSILISYPHNTASHREQVLEAGCLRAAASRAKADNASRARAHAAAARYRACNREELARKQRQVRKRKSVKKHGIHAYIQRRFDAPIPSQQSAPVQDEPEVDEELAWFNAVRHHRLCPHLYLRLH